MTEYVAHLSLPDGEFAQDAAERLRTVTDRVSVADSVETAVWLSWSVDAESDEDGVYQLQEIRLRAEMTFAEDPETLFQGTPFIITRGASTIIRSEEVYCI